MTEPMESKSASAIRPVALVTGAGRRLGQAFAVGLAKKGFDVAVHYFTSQAGARDTKSMVELYNVRAETICADLTTVEGIETLQREFYQRFTRIDALINSSSPYPDPELLLARHSLLEEDVETFNQAIAINCRAPFFLIQRFAPQLTTSPYGVVVNVLDESIDDPFLSRAAHSVAKSGLFAVTKLAAKALAGNVRVHGLVLGNILPPDGLSGADQKKLDWRTPQEAVEALCELVTVEEKNSLIVEVK